MTLLLVENLVELRPVSDLFTDAFDFRQYRLLRKFGWYDDDVARGLNRMTKKVTMQMKDETFGGRDPVSIIGFLQDFRAACNDCSIVEGAALWLFKYFLADPVELDIKARVVLPAQASKAQKRCLTTYSATDNFLLTWYLTVENIAVVDGDFYQFRQGA